MEEDEQKYTLTNDEVDIICEALGLYAQLIRKIELKGNNPVMKSKEIIDIRTRLSNLKEDRQ